MGMNFNSVNGTYQKTSKGISIKATKAETSDVKSSSVSSEAKAENADKVLISSEAAEKYEVYRMTKSVMSQMNNVDNSKKLADLKERIQNKTYQIPAEAIAEKIMARFTED